MLPDRVARILTGAGHPTLQDLRPRVILEAHSRPEGDRHAAALPRRRRPARPDPVMAAMTDNQRPSRISGHHWHRARITGVWQLRTDYGTYTVTYSGFDFIVQLDGVRQITRRGGVIEAMNAAEDDLIKRRTSATHPEPAERTYTHADVCQALAAALADPTDPHHDTTNSTVRNIAGMLGIPPSDYHTNPTRET